MAQCLSVTGRETFDRLMDRLRKFALPVNDPVAFGSLRAAAAPRGENPATSRLTAMNLHVVNTERQTHFLTKKKRTYDRLNSVNFKAEKWNTPLVSSTMISD